MKTSIGNLIPKQTWYFLGAIWILFIVNLFTANKLNWLLGIQPRSIGGLTGLITYSFAHGSLTHILANSFPILILSPLVAMATSRNFLTMLTIAGALGSGLLAWSIGAGGYVVGASGVVYCFIGFLIANAYFNPSARSILIAVISFFAYGGAIFSLFSFMPGISWSAHIGGMITGILMAAIVKKLHTYDKSTDQ